MGHYGYVHFHKTPIDFRTSSFKNVHAHGSWAVDAHGGQQLYFKDPGRCDRGLCRALRQSSHLDERGVVDRGRAREFPSNVMSIESVNTKPWHHQAGH